MVTLFETSPIYKYIIITTIIILLLTVFFPLRLLVNFHWSLKESNFLQVSRILSCILADLS